MSPTEAHHLLVKLVRAESFRMFIIRTVDGREFEVVHETRLALPAHPGAGSCVVYVGQELNIISLDMIASIEVAR